MPRFVILRHEFPPGHERASHWDFMLQRGDVLRTWALADEPRAGARIVGTALADHRREYLDYAGPVSGGRGSVEPWDSGTYALVGESDARWIVELSGRKLRGRVTIARQAVDAQRWDFVFHDDRPATRGG